MFTIVMGLAYLHISIIIIIMHCEMKVSDSIWIVYPNGVDDARRVNTWGGCARILVQLSECFLFPLCAICALMQLSDFPFTACFTY